MIHLPDRKFILASRSPRRNELLKVLGLEFEVRTKETEEDFPEDMPANRVAGYLSEKKALAFEGDLSKEDVLITADTVVILENRILGKPKDEEEAIAMLTELSGKMHEVITGVTLMDKEHTHTFQDAAKVFFKPVSSQEIHYYVRKFQPYDKAGAYGIQEWIGLVAVEKIEGSFYTVMGLPVHLIYQKLKDFKE